MRMGAIGAILLLAACSDRNAEITEGPLNGHAAIPADVAGGEQLSDLGTDGLRVLIQPSFGRYHYYLSLRRLPQDCLPRELRRRDGSDSARACGPTLIRARRIDRGDRRFRDALFVLPVEESDNLFEELDARLRTWRGARSRWLDGTGISLERVGQGRVRSMTSNQPALADGDNPAAQLQGDLLRILLAYGPAGFAPRRADWNVPLDEEAEDPCNDPALAMPLDRGFGTGNSDCDATARWPAVKALALPLQSGDAMPQNKERK
jgi:hypothetical protein